MGSTSHCSRKFESQLGHIMYAEIDYGITSKVTLPLPLIQEGQFSFTGESKCTSTGTKPAQEKFEKVNMI